jgi:hypothetical protein
MRRSIVGIAVGTPHRAQQMLACYLCRRGLGTQSQSYGTFDAPGDGRQLYGHPLPNSAEPAAIRLLRNVHSTG